MATLEEERTSAVAVLEMLEKLNPRGFDAIRRSGRRAALESQKSSSRFDSMTVSRAEPEARVRSARSSQQQSLLGPLPGARTPTRYRRHVVSKLR